MARQMRRLKPKQSPEKRADYNRQYKAIPENRVKIRAREAVQNALRYGKMARQPCEVCGAEKTHGHHDDYSKPLDVRWLCHSCHAAEHQGRSAARSALPARTLCSKGHALAGDNLFMSGGRHCCRQCNRAYQRFQYWNRIARTSAERVA